MSLFTTNILYPANLSIPNGYANQMTDKPKNKIIFLDITPPRTAHMKSPSVNSIHPLRDNLIEPQINRDIIYENIKPVFFLLRVLGVLPLSRPSPGVNQFQIASPSMIYSVGCYICLVLYVLYLSLHKVQILRTAEGKFEEAVIEYLFTVYLFPMLLVPIMWYETRKIAGILNGWVEFEICYKKLSGRVLPVKLYKKALAIAVIIPVLSSSSVIITHVTMVDFKAMQIIPYIFLEILTYILGGYWYLLCETLSLCATVLAEDFQMALRNIGPAGKVAEYRALWLRLSKLARGTGIANCYTFTFVNLYLFLIITLSIYGLLSQISEGFGVKDIGLAVTACCSIFLLFFICDEAHYASQNLRSQQGRIHHWEHPSEPRNPNSLIGKVAEYRTMWLCLSKLARGTGIANCYTFTFVNLYLFLIITLSIYGLLSQISEGFGVKDIGLAVTACCSIFLLFFICDEAHYASQNVRTNFQKKLLMVELSWMNTDAQTEVNMFLRATEMNPSQISLGGFFDVNRNLFKSLLATMVTYLVVLLQFQISIPDDKRPDEMESEEKLFNITSFAPSETTASTTSLATTILTTLARKKKKN